MKKLAILASGNGTNAQQITEYFAGRNDVMVDVIIYNKKDAYVATRAAHLGIESRYFCRRDFMETDAVLDFLRERKVDYLILAGFLLLVPQNLLDAFPNRPCCLNMAARVCMAIMFTRLLSLTTNRNRVLQYISLTIVTIVEQLCSKLVANSILLIRPMIWLRKYTFLRRSISLG